METILERIISEKRKEVELLRSKQKPFVDSPLPRRSFINKLENDEGFAVIAEFKRSSPSKGIINGDADPVEQAIKYETSGAAAISVLTDRFFFNGTFDDLKAVKSAVSIPVLCKDFIIDPLQIERAAAYGADLILLIAAALEDHRLKELYDYAINLGLEALVEVHNAEEVERVLKMGARLIGVNNRDLKTFHVSLEMTEKLAPLIKESGALLISESGIQHQEDVMKVRSAGANGILVGEALMKTRNVHTLLLEFKDFSFTVNRK